MTEMARRALPGLLLAALVVTAHAPALLNGYIWDDDFYVTGNRNLADLAGLARIWLTTSATPQYYPLTHTSFWIEYRLWGLRPAGFHAVNLLLHAASTVVLWRVLRRLQVPGAWLAAAVFGVHPVHVESVAWVTERKNVLSGLLYLGSALVFLRHAFPEDGKTEDGKAARSIRGPLAALLLYLGALLSKTVTASLPVALALVLLWKRGRLERRHAGWLAAMAVLGVGLGTLTVLLEKHQVGAYGPEFSLSFLDRGLLAGRVLWFYLGKLVLPTGLSFVYPRWTIDSGSLASFAYPVAALASFAALSALARRVAAGPLVAALYFAVTLAPASGFFDVFPMRYSWVADHFQYLASIGPIALFAAGAALASRGALPGLGRPLAAPAVRALAGALLVALSALSWQHARNFRDLETLWRSTLAVNPGAFIAHYNLANLLKQDGRAEEAVVHYRETIRIKPDVAGAYTNLGNLMADRKELGEAIALYRRGMALAPEDPLAAYNLALAYEETGQVDEAIAAYREAIRRRPDLGGAHNNLAILLLRRGDRDGARAEAAAARRLGVEPHPDFLRAIEREPDQP